MLNVFPVPAFKDNYFWVIDDGQRDVLFGNSSLDFYFLGLNDLSDQGDDEENN